jgi:hypothetical protein
MNTHADFPLWAYTRTNDDGTKTPLSDFRGRILYHGTWTGGSSKSRWGEPLTGPNGVFIIEYESKKPTVGSEGYYMGIYYYGLDSVQTKGPESGNTIFPYGLTTPIGLNICYFGNSYDLTVLKNPEAATAEAAIDRFTKENINRYIAFIAVPWYRKYNED